jgi:hypothetical protein
LSEKNLIFLLFFLFLPFIASFGTNTPILGHVSFFSSPLFATLALIFIFFGNKSKLIKLLYLVNYILIILFTFLIFYQSLKTPYRAQNLFESKIAVSVGKAKGLHVSPDYYEYLLEFENIRKYLENHKGRVVSVAGPDSLFFTRNDPFAPPWIGVGAAVKYKVISEACYIFAPRDLVLIILPLFSNHLLIWFYQY